MKTPLVDDLKLSLSCDFLTSFAILVRLVNWRALYRASSESLEAWFSKLSLRWLPVATKKVKTWYLIYMDVSCSMKSTVPCITFCSKFVAALFPILVIHCTYREKTADDTM